MEKYLGNEGPPFIDGINLRVTRSITQPGNQHNVAMERVLRAAGMCDEINNPFPDGYTKDADGERMVEYLVKYVADEAKADAKLLFLEKLKGILETLLEKMPNFDTDAERKVKSLIVNRLMCQMLFHNINSKSVSLTEIALVLGGD